MSNIGTSGLASFLLEMYADFSRNRQLFRESVWQDIIDAFEGNLSGISARMEEWQSNAFVLYLKSKVVAAKAMIVDMELQGGQIPFNLITDEDSYKDMSIPYEAIEMAKGKMESRIHSQIKDANTDREMMQMIECAAMYGETFSKSNLYLYKKKMQYMMQSVAPPGMPTDNLRPEDHIRPVKQQVVNEIPAIGFMSIWDCFMDYEGDVQTGRGFFHRQMMSPYELRKKLNRPGYNNEAIKNAIGLASGGVYPDTITSLQPILRDISNPKKVIRYLEFYGRVPVDELKRISNDSPDFLRGFNFDMEEATQRDDGNEVEVIACLANDYLIRLLPSPLDRRPIYHVKWENVLDRPWGRGVGENSVKDQMNINDIYRRIFDNISLAGNVMVAMKDEFMEDKDFKTYPGKVFHLSELCDDVKKSIQQINIADVSDGLFKLLNATIGFADQDNQIPQVIDGQPAKGKKTAFEIDKTSQSSGKISGLVLRNFDEDFIEPAIEDYYDYNMDMGKGFAPWMGAFKVHANGFQSFQNKYVRRNNISQLMQMVMQNPELMKMVKIRPHLEEIYKSLDVSPADFLYTDQEVQQNDIMQKIQPILMAISQNLRIPPQVLLQAGGLIPPPNAQEQGGNQGQPQPQQEGDGTDMPEGLSSESNPSAQVPGGLMVPGNIKKTALQGASQ